MNHRRTENLFPGAPAGFGEIHEVERRDADDAQDRRAVGLGIDRQVAAPVIAEDRGAGVPRDRAYLGQHPEFLRHHLRMMSFLEGPYRRLRFGKPIVVVSGLPRSGTSMAMKMLEAGGMSIVTDGKRTPDESNPKGYYEFEPVMRLHEDPDKRWLAEVRGKAVKIISFLLGSLPETFSYRVIFMHRNLDEVMASQSKMLETRGESQGADADNDALMASYRTNVEKTERLLARRSCFDVLDVDYKSVLDDAAGAAARIGAFVGDRLDTGAMAAAVDQQLYRNRHRAANARRRADRTARLIRA